MQQSNLFTLGLLAALLIVGCQPSQPAAPDHSNVRVHLPKEPRRLFPLLAASSYETQVNDLIYQHLLHFDPTTEELAPELAENIPTSSLIEGNTHYSFQLRKLAKWSDGEPVRVEDVIFTFKAIWFPGLGASPLRGSIRELVDIQPTADKPGAFNIVASTANLNGAASYGNIPILPEHIYDPAQLLRHIDLPTLIAAKDTADLPAALRAFAVPDRIAPFGKTTIVGSGPYRFDSWEEGQRIRLIKNNEFWGNGLPGGLFLAGPDTIEYYPVPDAQAALAMLENGDLDVLANITPREAIRLKETSTKHSIYTPLQLTRTFVYFNTNDPILNDVETRKGLTHLLDVAGFLADVQLGFGQPLYGPYHPIQPYASVGNHPVPFDIDAARSQFSRAGWSDSDGDGILDKLVDGQRMKLAVEYLYPSVSKSSEALALLYAEDAKKAGVEVTPIGKEFGALIGDLSARKFQLVQGALGGEPLPDDPYSLWHTKSDTPRGKNRSGFGTAQTDALIDSIRINLNVEERAAQYTRLASAIASQQPVMFLIVPQERIAVRKGIEPVITARRPGYYVPGFSESLTN